LNILLGKVGRSDDRKRSHASCNHWQHKIGVIGRKVRKPKESLVEHLRVQFREVAHVSEGEKPCEEDGDLEQVEHGDEVVNPFLFQAHFVLILGLISQQIITAHCCSLQFLAISPCYLLYLALSNSLKLSSEGRITRSL